MIKKITSKATSNLDDLLNSAERDSYLDYASSSYRVLKAHLEACKAIAMDIAPKEYVFDAISVVHHINIDMMRYRSGGDEDPEAHEEGE